MIELLKFGLGRHVSAEKSASRWRLLRCDECRTEYVYEQTLTGSGQAWNAFHLRTRQAIAAARETADKELQHKLASQEHSPVFCPACGAFPLAVKQAALHEVFTLWTRRTATLAGSTALFTMLFVMLFFPEAELHIVLMVPAGFAIAIAIVSYFFFLPTGGINRPEEKARRLASPVLKVMPLSDFQAYFDRLPEGTREEILQTANHGLLVRQTASLS